MFCLQAGLAVCQTARQGAHNTGMCSAQEAATACDVLSSGRIESTGCYLADWLQRMCTASIFLQSILLQAEVKRVELEQQRVALQQRRQLLATTVQERNRLYDIKQRTLEQHDMYVQLQRLEQQIRTLNQVSTGVCFLKLSSKCRAANVCPLKQAGCADHSSPSSADVCRASINLPKSSSQRRLSQITSLCSGTSPT